MKGHPQNRHPSYRFALRVAEGRMPMVPEFSPRDQQVLMVSPEQAVEL